MVLKSSSGVVDESTQQYWDLLRFGGVHSKTL